ncbi:MAG TPA: Ig-like domain-containing protein, partial [Clostridia bacterium]|nr:Ig-like domain-containing protein [Clostridia bacterium]
GNFIYQSFYYYDEDEPLNITTHCFSRTNDGYLKTVSGANINWAIYDCNNNIIKSGQGITDNYGYLDVNVKITSGYYGRIKLVASTDAFPEYASDTCLLSIPKKCDYTYNNGSLERHSNNGVFGVMPNTNQGTISFYYPSNSASPIASAPVIDGAFYAPELQSIQGKIKAVYEDGLGQCFEKYLTKDACDYFLLMAPNIPTGLYAKNEANKSILSWTAVDNAQAYNIRRSLTLGGEYVTIASNITGNSFVDDTCNGSAQYYYKVSAVSCGNESADSSVLKVESTQMPKTKIILESSANPSELWKPVIFKAKVLIDSDNPADQNVHPTGKVIFRQDGYDIPSGSVDVVDGVATYTYNYTDGFPYEFSAEFQSDKYLGSSASLIQCYKRRTVTKLTITPISEDPSNSDKFIIKATVSASDGFNLELGKITIKDGENILGIQNISGVNGHYYNDKPSYEYVLESQPLSPGTHQITAEYQDTKTSIYGKYFGSSDTVSLEVKTPPAIDDSPIASINNLEVSAYLNSSYPLPEKVAAVTEKGGTREVAVSWNPSYASTNRVGTYTFTGTVDGYPNGVMLTLTVKPEISSIAYYNINASTFQNTPYTLPATITANMSDGTKQQAPILWENPNVDTSQTGRFEFVGSVEGYTRSKVTITLDVHAPIESISDINASVFEDDPYTLPSTVTAKLTDGWYLGPLEVKWSPSSVDTRHVGTYTFKGTVDGYNGNVTLTLTVKPRILSVAYYAINASTFQNTPYTLPSTITANMSDGTKQQAPILWENPNVDTSQTGKFKFIGSVEGYTRSKVTITLYVRAPIASIDNIDATVIQNQSYILPKTVTAKLTDGCFMGPLEVVWSVSAVDTSIPGVYTYEGTVEGYSKKVLLTLTVTAESI